MTLAEQNPVARVCLCCLGQCRGSRLLLLLCAGRGRPRALPVPAYRRRRSRTRRGRSGAGLRAAPRGSPARGCSNPLLCVLGRARARSSPAPRGVSECCQELFPVQELRPVPHHALLSGLGESSEVLEGKAEHTVRAQRPPRAGLAGNQRCISPGHLGACRLPGPESPGSSLCRRALQQCLC